MKRLILIILFIIPIYAFADFDSDLYLKSKEEYQKENYEEAHILLQEYVKKHESFLEQRPIAKSQILIVIEYCLIRIVVSGIDGPLAPKLP